VRAEVSDKLVKLPLSELKQVDHRVLIAGPRSKGNALRAILRSKVANTPIADVQSAQALLPEGSDLASPAAREREGRT